MTEYQNLKLYWLILPVKIIKHLSYKNVWGCSLILSATAPKYHGIDTDYLTLTFFIKKELDPIKNLTQNILT